MARHGGAVEIDEESRRFTPSPIDRNACLARTWNNGLGGQCTRQQVGFGVVLCAAHLRQEESERGLAHGRVDGPVPGPKLCEFLRGHTLEASTPEPPIMHRRGPGPEPWRGQRRPGGFGEESWMEPPAKRRPPPPAEWLAVDGSVIENAEPSGRNRVGWSSLDLWAQALPRLRDRSERSGRFIGEVDRKDPWVLGVASAIVRAETVRSRDSKSLGDIPGPLAIASQSVHALQRGMERWFHALLTELLDLSSHRFCLSERLDESEECVNVFDFGLPATRLAEAEAFANAVEGDNPPAGGARTWKASRDTEARARKIWFEELHHRQHLRRIGPADLKALMGRPRAAVALASSSPEDSDSREAGGALRVPEVVHSHFQRKLAEEDLD